MLLFLISTIIFAIVIYRCLNPIVNSFTVERERRRIEREMELERLQQENYNRIYSENISRNRK